MKIEIEAVLVRKDNVVVDVVVVVCVLEEIAAIANVEDVSENLSKSYELSLFVCLFLCV